MLQIFDALAEAMEHGRYALERSQAARKTNYVEHPIWGVVAEGAPTFDQCVDRVVERAVLRECTPIPHLYGHSGQEL